MVRPHQPPAGQTIRKMRLIAGTENNNTTLSLIQINRKSQLNIILIDSDLMQPSALCFKRFTIFQNILTKLSIIFKSCFDLTCKFTPRFNFLFQEYFSFTVSWLNRGQDWDGGSWEKLIKIMLQSYYNIKIMLIVYSLDQYVFLIMEYI